MMRRGTQCRMWKRSMRPVPKAFGGGGRGAFGLVWRAYRLSGVQEDRQGALGVQARRQRGRHFAGGEVAGAFVVRGGRGAPPVVVIRATGHLEVAPCRHEEGDALLVGVADVREVRRGMTWHLAVFARRPDALAKVSRMCARSGKASMYRNVTTTSSA